MAPYEHFDPYALGMFRPGMQPWLPQGMEQSPARGVGGVPTPYNPQQMGSFFGRPQPQPDPVDLVTDEILERLFEVGEVPRPNADFGPRKSRGPEAHKQAWSPYRPPAPRTTPYDVLTSQFGGTGHGQNYTGPQAQPPAPQLGSAFDGPRPGQSVSPGLTLPNVSGWLQSATADYDGAATAASGQGAPAAPTDPSQLSMWQRFMNYIQPVDPRTGKPTDLDLTTPEPGRPAPAAAPGQGLPRPPFGAGGGTFDRNAAIVPGETITPGQRAPRGLPRPAGGARQPAAAPGQGLPTTALPVYPNAQAVSFPEEDMEGPLDNLPVDPNRMLSNVDEPPAVKSSFLGQLFSRMADALPGALVAFAADRAHSPELAQQYTEMKRRELAEIQDRRRAEIEKMGQGAEMYRHMATMDLQRSNARFNVEQTAQELQRTLGTTDPFAYSKAIQSLARHYATMGGNARQLAAAYPFLKGEHMTTARARLNAQIKALGGASKIKEGMGRLALIEDPFRPGEQISIDRLSGMLNGYDSKNIPIVPDGLDELDTFSWTDPTGVRYDKKVGRFSAANLGTQVTHPQPQLGIIQTANPAGGTFATPTIMTARGGLQLRPQQDVPGTMAGGVGEPFSQMQVQFPMIELRPIAMEIMRDLPEFANKLPTDAEVNTFLTIPRNRDLAQRLSDQRKQLQGGRR